MYAVLLRRAAVTHVLQRANDKKADQQPQTVEDDSQTDDADDEIMKFKGIGSFLDVENNACGCHQHEAKNQPEDLLAETRGGNVNVRHSV